MPRAASGTPKAIANAQKAKGLQRLRWYCQVCEKQCRDENGFKCHTQSEGHLRQMLVVGENAGKHIGNYSEQFKHDFLTLLSRRWGTKRVRANQVYQEFITDKQHTHMNATRWVTLTEFVKYLGREGIVHADETEKGWYIEWIDSSPKALAKQAAHQAKERSDMDDEQRMRKLIEEQIAKAEAEKADRGEGGSGSSEEESKGLEREEGAAPFTLSFGGVKKDPSPPVASTSTADPTSAPAADEAKPAIGISLAPKPNPFKMNPLKRPAPSSNPLKPNPLKAASSSSSSSSKPAKPAMSAMEAIIAEEEERKRRRDMHTWSGRGGHGAEGLQVKRQRV